MIFILRNFFLIFCVLKKAHLVSVNILFFFLIFIFYLTVPGLSCGMKDLQSQHVGSSFLTRDPTQAPCIGNMESQPLDHQGSPSVNILNEMVNSCFFFLSIMKPSQFHAMYTFESTLPEKGR